jgi:hypothetical protein
MRLIASRDGSRPISAGINPIVEIDMTDVTFSPQQLQQVIAEAVAVALAARNAKPVPANKLVNGRTELQLKTDIAVCKAFRKAGYGDVQPRIDVMTDQRWLAAGYRVRPGERATKIKQFRLFHRSQVEAVELPSKAEQQAEADAAVAAHAATAAKPGIVARLKAKATSAAPAQSSLGV